MKIHLQEYLNRIKSFSKRLDNFALLLEQPYILNNEYVFLFQKRRQIALIRKRIVSYGIDPNELGIFTRPRYRKDHEEC